MSCSRETCSAKAETVAVASAKPPSSSREKRLMYEKVMFSRPTLSLVLYLQPVRADIDLQSLRLFPGQVEIVAEHAHRDDQRTYDEIENIAIAGHPCLHGAQTLARYCTGAAAILKATSENGTK
jgi:hypothetical protein